MHVRTGRPRMSAKAQARTGRGVARTYHVQTEVDELGMCAAMDVLLSSCADADAGLGQAAHWWAWRPVPGSRAAKPRSAWSCPNLARMRSEHMLVIGPLRPVRQQHVVCLDITVHHRRVVCMQILQSQGHVQAPTQGVQVAVRGTCRTHGGAYCIGRPFARAVAASA